LDNQCGTFYSTGLEPLAIPKQLRSRNFQIPNGVRTSAPSSTDLGNVPPSLSCGIQHPVEAKPPRRIQTFWNTEHTIHCNWNDLSFPCQPRQIMFLPVICVLSSKVNTSALLFFLGPYSSCALNLIWLRYSTEKGTLKHCHGPRLYSVLLDFPLHHSSIRVVGRVFTPHIGSEIGGQTHRIPNPTRVDHVTAALAMNLCFTCLFL
jgi:hypothetical protein